VGMAIGRCDKSASWLPHGQTVNVFTANVTGSAPAGGSFGIRNLVAAEPACAKPAANGKALHLIRPTIAHAGRPPVLPEPEGQTDIVAVSDIASPGIRRLAWGAGSPNFLTPEVRNPKTCVWQAPTDGVIRYSISLEAKSHMPSLDNGRGSV
jgi:hypothetical protein